MEKTLSFTDTSSQTVKIGDTTTSFTLICGNDNVAADLTKATSITAKLGNDDGYLKSIEIDPTKLVEPWTGKIIVNFSTDLINSLPAGNCFIEVWVVDNTGISIYPSNGSTCFTIANNIERTTGNTIARVAFSDFVEAMNKAASTIAKGDPGEGLNIKGQVTSVSALPATANEGDGYLVNEELYVYTSGAWKDCGTIQGPQGIQGKTGTGISSTTIQYQISNSATTAPTGTWSNNIVATTTANPYLWMKATLNYTDNTTKDFYLISQKGDKGDKGDTGAVDNAGLTTAPAFVELKTQVDNKVTDNKDGTIEVNGSSIKPADNSKVVQSTDMRRPASDVAGIDEVNTKQDKIGYTPADDSKVVHSTGDEEIAGTKTFDTAPIDKTTGNPYITKDGLTTAPAFAALQTEVDNSAVGTNLLLGTYNQFIMTGNNTVNQVQNAYSLSKRLEAGTEVTISFDAISTDLTKFIVLSDGTDGGDWITYTNNTVDSTKKHYVSTITLNNFSDLGTAFRLDNVPSTTAITVSNMKLELGSHATDWSLNPSEILAKAEQTATTNQTLNGIKTYTSYPEYINNVKFSPSDDTGWLVDGLKLGSSVTSGVYRYRVLSIGKSRQMILDMQFKFLNKMVTGWGSADQVVFYFPSIMMPATFASIPVRYTGSDSSSTKTILTFRTNAPMGSLAFDGIFSDSKSASDFPDGTDCIMHANITLSDRRL